MVVPNNVAVIDNGFLHTVALFSMLDFLVCVGLFAYPNTY